jgi:hypothetical protein
VHAEAKPMSTLPLPSTADGPAPRRYRDFDLDVAATPTSLDLTVLASPAGEVRVSLPAASLGTLTPTAQQLFGLLFPPDIRALYDTSRALADREQHSLRIRLRAHSLALAALPWELITDPRDRMPLALSHATPIVRSVAVPQPVRALAHAGPIRLLMIAASPSDLPPLRLADERARLEASVAELCREGLLEIEYLARATWRSIQATLRRGPWHVIHFAGHGGADASSPAPFVVLEDEVGMSFRLSALQLARMVADQRALRLVVLNACDTATVTAQYPGLASYLIRTGLPAVLAMQRQISDRASIEFARTFYEALASGMPIESAGTDARNAVELTGSAEWGVPVIYLRGPSGEIFGRPLPAARPAPTPLRRTLPPDPHPARRTLARMPLARSQLFVGRALELQTIETLMARERAVVVLSGPGGSGKTQLAAEYVYRASAGERFPGGIFWLSFADPELIPSEVAACGQAFATDPAAFAALPQQIKVDVVLTELRRSPPCLLVFDGLEDVALLQRWLPQETLSSVLVTSRQSPHAWPQGLGLQQLPLRMLKRAESRQLLLRYRPDLAGHERGLEALAAELGDHPLALHLAGTFLARYAQAVTLSGYLAELRASGLQHPSLCGAALSPTGHQQTLLAIVSHSYAQLREDSATDRVARALLDRLALIGRGAMLERDLLLATLERDERVSPHTWRIRTADALDRLLALGLIEQTTDQTGRWTSYGLHELVAAFVQRR